MNYLFFALIHQYTYSTVTLGVSAVSTVNCMGESKLQHSSACRFSIPVWVIESHLPETKQRYWWNSFPGFIKNKLGRAWERSRVNGMTKGTCHKLHQTQCNAVHVYNVIQK